MNIIKNKNNGSNLYQLLENLSDHRREQGRRHQLKLIVMLVIMSLMSGSSSLRAMGDFIKRNQKELLRVFKPDKDRLPSHQTIGRALQHIDFDELSGVFYSWALKQVNITGQEWVAVDGKAIAGTVTNSQNKFQQFTGLVSLFISKRKTVLASTKLNNKKDNEILKLRELVDMLSLTGVVITADALHCQADTLTSIKASGNDYCIGVKKNQPNLLRAIKKK